MAEILTDPGLKRLMLECYLDELSRRRWIWSESDCVMAVADWVQYATGIDPAADVRGTYHNATQAREALRQRGGYQRLISHALDCDFARTEEPEIGDVALVLPGPRFRDQVMGGLVAIRNHHDLWIMKTRHGIVGQRFEVLTAWRI